jgi:hypothetical protein
MKKLLAFALLLCVFLSGCSLLPGTNNTHGSSQESAYKVLRCDAQNFSVLYGTVYQAGYSFPQLNNFAVIESLPISTYFSNICTDEALVRGSFQSSRGTSCCGKFCASIYSVGTYYYNGADMLPLSALSVSGVMAPEGDFLAVEQILSDAVYSLTFTESYVSDALTYIKKTGEGYMAANSALQATYDSYNINRDQYSNPDLQIIDGSTESYYLDGVDYYITN